MYIICFAILNIFIQLLLILQFPFIFTFSTSCQQLQEMYKFNVFIEINSTLIKFEFTVLCGYHQIIESVDSKLADYNFILGMCVCGRNMERSGILVIPNYNQTYFKEAAKFKKLLFSE